MTAHQNAGTPPDARADRAPLHRDRRHPAVTLAAFFVSHLTPVRVRATAQPGWPESKHYFLPTKKCFLCGETFCGPRPGRLSNAEANNPIAIGSWPATAISGAVVLVQREKDYLSCSSR